MRLLFTVLLLTSLWVSDTYAQFASQNQDIIKGKIIVRLDNDLNSIQKKSLSDPIQVLEAQYGVSSKSLWKPEYEQTLRKKLAEKGKLNKSISSDKIAGPFAHAYEITLRTGMDERMMARKISSVPGVKYAEPLFIRQTAEVPNDPLLSQLGSPNYFDDMNFFDAWDVSKSSSDVIIAIVDSGVDYTHEDLDGKLWINEGETPGNGVDDDENGFIDDDKGWDFWNAGPVFDPEQDNDPIGDYSDHGTHVAGIAAAETNNGTGFPGAGYNASYMAIKAGGTEDNPRSVGYGFSGIQYAVINGADIINCSWGGGGFSAFENEVINWATENGSLVIAAAGNDGIDGAIFPSAYQNALSVAWLDVGGRKNSSSNFGYMVDVGAVGSSVRNTTIGTSYVSKSGTSMASPFVSGLAALIKSEHPDWEPQRIATHIRASARDNSGDNLGSLSSKLGNGVIDAHKAVTTNLPGLSITDYAFGEGENQPQKGDNNPLKVTITNYGKTVSNVSLTIEALERGLSVTEAPTSISSLAHNESIEIDLTFRISPLFDLYSQPAFRVEYAQESESYSDFGIVAADPLILSNIASESLLSTISSDGTIGFLDPITGTGGLGIIPFNEELGEFSTQDNILFSGSFMLGVNGTVYDRAISQSSTDRDFTPSGLLQVVENAQATEMTGTFGTNFNADHDLDIQTSAYAPVAANASNNLILRYDITNNGDATVSEIYTGLYLDLDIISYVENSIHYNSEEEVIFVKDSDSGTELFTGVSPMTVPSSMLAIDNTYEAGNTGVNFGVYFDNEDAALDGYTEAEKWTSLTAGKEKTTQSATDISVATGSGPYVLETGESITAGFIIGYGHTEAEMLNQIAEAKALTLFTVSTPEGVSNEESLLDEFENQQPQKTKITRTYPNPFNPATTINYSVADAGNVTVDVLNVVGQKVATLTNQRQSAGSYSVMFNADGIPSGIYFVRLSTENNTSLKKITLIK